MRVKQLLVFVVLGISCLIGFIPLVHAAEPSPAQGIQVSPVLIDLNAEKSNAYNLKITVTNVTAGTLLLKSTINDFRAKDESGNPQVILDDKDIDPSFSFKNWVKPPANLTLKAKESRTVTVEVNIPSNAEAGGHYGVIRFSGTPPGEANNNLSIAASVGVLVLARVNGTINESLTTKEFFIEKNSKRSGLVQSSPFTVVERLANNGNVHIKPTGTVTVKNMLGGTTATLPVNDPPKNILPKSTRRLSQDVNKKWLFGRYTARLDLTYGYTGKVLSSTMSFWIIPYKLICIVLACLIILIFLLRILIKRYNRRIINKAYNHRKR